MMEKGRLIRNDSMSSNSSTNGDRIQKRSATEDPAVLQLSKEQKTANKAKIVCYGCGNAGHVPKNCLHRTSSDFNPSPSEPPLSLIERRDY